MMPSSGEWPVCGRGLRGPLNVGVVSVGVACCEHGLGGASGGGRGLVTPLTGHDLSRWAWLCGGCGLGSLFCYGSGLSVGVASVSLDCGCGLCVGVV